MSELMKLGDSPKFKRLTKEIMLIAQDEDRPRPDPVPQVPDWTNTTPDEWFELGLIRAGYDRYIKANDPY